MEQIIKNLESCIATLKSTTDPNEINLMINELHEKVDLLANKYQEKLCLKNSKDAFHWFMKWSVKIYDGSTAYGISTSFGIYGDENLQWEPYKAFSTEDELEQFLQKNTWFRQRYMEWVE